MKRSHRRQLPHLMAISIVMLGLLGSSHAGYDPVTESQDTSVLKVITKPSYNTYFEGKNGPDGMEFQLIQAFAQKHHLHLELILTDDGDAIYSALDQGLADVALLGRPLSIKKQDSYPKSSPYREVSSQLIFKAGSRKPDSLADLTGKKVVLNDNEQNRNKYRILKAYYGELEWEFSDQPVEDLLSAVSKGKIDYTIVDSHTFALKQSSYPNTLTAFNVYEPEPVSLLFSRKSSALLQDKLNAYIAESKLDNTIADLMERYYGHIDDFDTRGYPSFSFLMRHRLPAYQASIKAVAREYQMDWRLLAAIAYQESHWDPEARSKTGVRGMMMLTYNTAQEMGVDDRVDPEQSLRGGARYFNKILKQVPASVQEPDRTWLALAAYNVGLGHLQDAIELTRLRNGNSDSWLDIKQHLPLLAEREWHELTRYGYARGHEPVEYVQNIRRYYDILAWQFPLQFHEKKNTNPMLVVKTLDDVIQQQSTPIAANLDNEFRVSALLF